VKKVLLWDQNSLFRPSYIREFGDPYLVFFMQESYHDIIMIGASAGGIPPLLELLKSLPAGLQASLFVVMNRYPC
jgi:chemotaxis response regulator CheB